MAWRLGASARDRARIVAAALKLRRRRRDPGEALSLRLRLGQRETTLRVCDRSQVWTLYEIWVKDHYRASAEGNFDVILDLGANAGVATIFLHDHHPEARIIAVEPDPRTVPLLEANTAALERASVVAAAVGAEDGSAELVLDRLSWGTRVAGVGRSPATHTGPAVVVTTIPRLLERAGARPGERVLVKLDIEGSEWAILADAETALAGVAVVFGECHAIGAPDRPADYLATVAAAEGFTVLPTPRPELIHWRR